MPSTSIFAMSDRDIVHIFSMPRQLLVSKIASPPADVKKLDSFGRPSRSRRFYAMTYETHQKQWPTWTFKSVASLCRMSFNSAAE